MLSTTHFSFNRTVLESADLVLDDFGYPDDFFSFDGGEVPGRISVSGLSSWGGGTTNPKFYVQNVYQFKQDISWYAGRHALKFGGQFQRFQLNDPSGFHAGGSFSFDGREDFLRNDVSSANFVAPGSDNRRRARQNLIGVYVQDDISVRSGLTLNLGVRYEFITTPVEADGKMSNIRDLTEPHINTSAREMQVALKLIF